MRRGHLARPGLSDESADELEDLLRGEYRTRHSGSCSVCAAGLTLEREKIAEAMVFVLDHADSAHDVRCCRCRPSLE